MRSDLRSDDTGSRSESATTEERPTTPFTGEFGPESRAALMAVRHVLTALTKSEARKRARRAAVKTDYEASVTAVLCEAAVDLLARGGKGFRIPRSMSVLEQRDRYRSRALNPQLPVALDGLAGLGFIQQEKGFVEPASNKRWQTAVWPGAALVDLCDLHGLGLEDFRCDAPGDEIVLRRVVVSADGTKRMEPVEYFDNPAIKIMRREMQIINDALRAADIGLVSEHIVDLPFVDPMKRKLRRMFKLRPEHQNAGAAFREGGRLSGGFWLEHGFSSERRRNAILIDGEPVAEIDFGQAGLRILYGIAGARAALASAEELSDDLYSGIAARAYDDQARDAVKSFVGALMNTADDWQALLKLQGFAAKIVGRTFDDPRDVLKGAIIAVHRRHPAVAEFLPSEIGRQVQKVESDVLVQVLLRLMNKGICGLPVHDAVLVRHDRAEEAAALMLRAFEDVAGVPGRVTITRPVCPRKAVLRVGV